MKKCTIALAILAWVSTLTAQVSLSPEKPGLTEMVTLTFDASQGSAGLAGYEGDVYVHTGILNSQSTSEGDWKHVIAGWSENKRDLKMTRIANDLYELKFTISSLYGLPDDGDVTALTLVFRSEDGSKTGKASGDKDFYLYFKEPTFKRVTKASTERPKRDTAKLPQAFVSMEETEKGLRIKTTQGTVELNIFSTNSIQVNYNLQTHENPPSLAVIQRAEKPATSTRELSNKVIWETGIIDVEIQKEPFKLAYTVKGKHVLSEEKGFFDDGLYMGFRFNLHKDEMITGGGSRAGGINRRDKRFELYNKASYGYEESAAQMYYSMPVALSNRKYMLVFDNGAKGYMDIGAEEEYVLEFGAVGGRMSYLLVVDDEWKGLARNFTQLVGRQSMPPRWALGNIASRMGYHTQTEVEHVVDQYIADDIPLDGIVLDLFWFGKDVKGHMGNLEWDRDSFPQPEKMMKNLKGKGVKTVLITEPFIVEGTKKYKECVGKELLGLNEEGIPYMYDFYFGHTGLLDIFKEDTRSWFWKNVYKKQTLKGVAGWWGDLGEPEVHPDNMLHVNGRGDEIHNLYGHEWASLIHRGYAQDFPRRRPVVLMRSGFVGSQRYGMIPWSGDVNRSWGGLRSQVEIALTMSLQGLGWMHSDLGGFAGDYKDSELYLRWLQYGVFQPMYRTHAQEAVPSEPIFWDDTTKGIARDFIKLRYRMMPYNYTLAAINSSEGIPMMRPVYYLADEGNWRVRDYFDNASEYMWGDAFLVAPVVKKGAKVQWVTLPEGQVWFDFWDEQRFEGGIKVNYPVNMDMIPVFVRAGSFVPMVPDFRSCKDYSSSVLNLHYYHDERARTATGQMYEDDGESKDASASAEYLEFNAIYTHAAYQRSLTISLEGSETERSCNLIIHNIRKLPKQIVINGSAVGLVDFRYNEAKRILEVPLAVLSEKDEIVIEL
ncbi:MAG: TIM-barrel domain-containing protein [Bacteroidia bacterium]